MRWKMTLQYPSHLLHTMLYVWFMERMQLTTAEVINNFDNLGNEIAIVNIKQSVSVLSFLETKLLTKA